MFVHLFKICINRHIVFQRLVEHRICSERSIPSAGIPKPTDKRISVFSRICRHNNNFIAFSLYFRILNVIHDKTNIRSCATIIGRFLRVVFVACRKNARQNNGHCQICQNTENTLFLVGSHTSPQCYIAGICKTKQKYNKCIPARFCDKPTCSIWKKLCNAKNAPVTKSKRSSSKLIKFIAHLYYTTNAQKVNIIQVIRHIYKI